MPDPRPNAPPNLAFITEVQAIKSKLAAAKRRLSKPGPRQSVQHAQARYWVEYAERGLARAIDCWYEQDEEIRR